jgi:two-component system, sporulation sensor kinase E
VSVLTENTSTDSIDSFSQSAYLKFENMKNSKNIFPIQSNMVQERVEYAPAFPPLKFISQGHHYHASSVKIQLNARKTNKCTTPLIKNTRMKGRKIGSIINNEIFCNKAYQMERAFSELFLFSPCPMVLIAADSQKIVNVNDKFLMLAGHDRSAVLQWHINQLRKMILRQDFKNIRAGLHHHQSVKDYKCKVNGKSQGGCVVLLSAKYILWNKQKMILVTGVDISETIELKHHIERLSCLNLVGQIAASIGHEIRNPMTIVRGYLRFMQRKINFSDYTEQFSMMIRELDRANEIITDFLALAKNRVNGLTLQNINEIIEDIGPLIEAMASEIGHSIAFELQPVPDILVDRVDIHKVIINLVKNGFEAMDGKGKVVIRTYKEDKCIVLQVVDEGKGIPKEIFGKIGTPFFTTKEKGTGLGLSVCYQIAARHNALLDIHTSTAGSTFSLKFPDVNTVEKI